MWKKITITSINNDYCLVKRSFTALFDLVKVVNEPTSGLVSDRRDYKCARARNADISIMIVLRNFFFFFFCARGWGPGEPNSNLCFDIP